MSQWRASLRIARRDAWRHRGRSLLVVIMIGLPVAGVVFGDIAFRTFQLSPEQEVTTIIGTVADGWVSEPTGRRVYQSPPGSEQVISIERRIHGPRPTIDELVPEAIGVLETRLDMGGEAAVSAGDRSIFPEIRELDYLDPLAAGLVVQVAGRAPSRTGEIVVSRGVAKSLDLSVGDQVTVDDGEHQVVGVIRMAHNDWDQVIGGIGAFPSVDFRSGGDVSWLGTGWLVEVPGGVDYERWKQINALGSMVVSRAVAADPPAACSSDIPEQVRMCNEGPLSEYTRQQLAEAAALTALLVGIGLLQVVLMVGPAFAIGRRRQAHDLALVAAVGGSAKSVRRVVLAGGLVLGLAGGVAGLMTGIVAFQLARPAVSRLVNENLFATEIGPEVLLVLLVSSLTGLLAAWLPAVQASRQDVVTALAGRRGTVRGSRWVPVAGVIALGVGIAIAFFGALPGSALLLLTGTVTAELGLVALAPTIVGWVSRTAPRLPVAPRLAFRDAGRNRMRAGTAVAAVLAAVAGSTALAVYLASTEANQERHYQTATPIGSVALAGRGDWTLSESESAAVAAQLPTAKAVTMHGLPFRCATAGCGPWRFEVPKGAGCVGPDGATSVDWCTWEYMSRWRPWMVGGADTYKALTGSAPSGAVADMLAGGGVVAAGTSAQFIHDGAIRLENRKSGEIVTLPAIAPPEATLDGPERFEVWLTDDAASRLGLTPRPLGVTVLTTRTPTAPEIAAATHALAEFMPASTVELATPYQRHPTEDLALRLLLLAAGVIAVAATATAVGLAAADGRADLATLAAVGASPRTRRWLAASQATLVSTLGTVLGITGGLVIGIAAVNAATDDYVGTTEFVDPPSLPLAVPWSSLTTLAVVVPVIAVGLAWTFSRSRLPMVRRAD